MEKQLNEMAKFFEAVSNALDKSTDVSNTAQCAVYVRGVDSSFNLTEELL